MEIKELEEHIDSLEERFQMLSAVNLIIHSGLSEINDKINGLLKKEYERRKDTINC